MNKRVFVAFEIIGAAVTTALAVVLWQLYDLTGGSPLAVLVGAVNRSAWELMKGAAIPYMLFALVELMCARPYFRNFVVGKAAGLLVCAVLFLLVYCVWGSGFAAFSAAVIGGYALSYFLSTREMGQRAFFVPAWMFFALFFIMLISFTVYPPRLFLFRDIASGYFGVH